MKIKLFISMLTLFILANANIWAQGKTEITSKDAYTMLKNDKSIVVLDVRTPEEFNAGHIKGALNIDVKQADAFSKIEKLDRKARYLVHCRTFHRSSTAVDFMLKNGFKNVYQMMDGFNGWQANNLESVK